MKTKSLFIACCYTLAILVFLAIATILFAPTVEVFADSNAPTETYTPEPTNTNTPAPPTEAAPPTDTAIPLATNPPEGILAATPMPLPTVEPNGGGLSPLNRMLLVCLSVVTVLVIGVIVYLVYYQTRGGGLGSPTVSA